MGSAHYNPKDVIPMDVKTAIETAERMLADTSVMFDPKQHRGIIAALLEGIKTSKCFYNGLTQGRRTFVLLEGDPAAPEAIRCWANEGLRCGHQPEKCAEALQIATDFARSEVKKPG